MQLFVSLALKIQEELHITDKMGVAATMRFSKLYPPDKLVAIVTQAKKYPWWQDNPSAAFMKAVGEVNKTDTRKYELEKKPKKPFVQKRMKLLIDKNVSK